MKFQPKSEDSILLGDIVREQKRVDNLNRLDILDSEKRLTRILGTPEGKEALRRVTGLRDLVFAGEAKAAREEEKLPIVAVLMPSYRTPMKQAQDALAKMFNATRGHAQVFVEPTISSSIVHWSRNDALSRLLKTFKPWDYVLFIDDDIAPAPDALIKLLAHKVDVVAAACTLRCDPPMPNFRIFNAETLTYHTCFDWSREGLIGGLNYGVGTGMILLSHDALQRVGEYYINCKFEEKFWGVSGEALDKLQTARQQKAKDTANFWWYEFLKHPLGDGEYGEDISFCFKCTQLGIPVHVDTTVRPKHIGDYGYNLDDYLDIKQDFKGKSAQAAQVPQTYDETISILIPTRGRPDNVSRVLQSLNKTSCSEPEVVLYIDDDDDSMKQATDAGWVDGEFLYPRLRVVRGPRRTLSECWNECAKVATGNILMHGGDDLVFKTDNWDAMVFKAFYESPDKLIFVHGDDGYWGDRFGTHGFLHRRWVQVVGYFVPPYFSSDYNDTWLNDVANALGRRVYLPFVTEHMHPLFGKAEWDKTHKERLERHKKDKVEDLYRDLAPKREKDIEKLRVFIQAPKQKEQELISA